MDGPDGYRDRPQPRWRGGRGGCHPAQSCARYARAPKSVICPKVSQEITRVPISGKTRCGLAPVPPATFLRRAVLAGTKWRPLELAMVASGGKGPPISDEHLLVPASAGLIFWGNIYRAKRSVGARPAPAQSDRAPFCALFGSLCEVIVFGGNIEHRLLGRFVVHLIREGARFFCALPPMLRIVDEGCCHGADATCRG